MGNSNCCENSTERQNENNLELDKKHLQRPYSERNYKQRGEISIPYKFEDYEATEQYIPKRDKVIIRSTKMFEDSKGRYLTPFRKKIIHQILLNERAQLSNNDDVIIDEVTKSKFNKQIRDEMMRHHRPGMEVRDKEISDGYQHEILEPTLYDFIDPNKSGRSKFEEEKKQYRDYSSIDLSNKKHSMEDSSQKRKLKYRDSDKYSRVHGEEGKYQYANSSQELSSREIESDTGKQGKIRKKAKGYMVKNYLSPTGEIESQQVVESQEINLRSRDTQTPVRKTVNEGTQLDEEEMKSTFSKIHKKQKSSMHEKSLEGEESKLPFSTIKKREDTDSESERKLLGQSPLRDMDEEEILNLVRSNEKLQRMILSDPALRDRLYERYGMKPSSSDHTLPYSQFSSKHEGDRRTQAHSNLFRTPMRDEDSKHYEESNRFTQFAHSENFGRDGTIYDEGTGYKRPEHYEDESRYTEEYKKGRSTQHVPKEEFEDEERANFSFKNKQRMSDPNTGRNLLPYSKQQYSNTLDMDDNENDLVAEGEENIEGRASQADQAKKVRATGEKKVLDEKYRSHSRSQQLKDLTKRTSQYKKRHHRSPMRYDPKTGKKVFVPQKKIDIRHNKNQLLGDSEGEYSHNYSGEQEGESSAIESSEHSHKTPRDKPIHSQSSLSALKKRYGSGLDASGKKLKEKKYSQYEDSKYSKAKKGQRIVKKESQSDEYNEGEHSSSGEEHKRPSGHKSSKSGAVSYQDPKYSSEKLTKSLKKHKQPTTYDETHGKHVAEPGRINLTGNSSDELIENIQERDSDDRAQDTPHSQHLDRNPGQLSQSYRGKRTGTASGNQHSIQGKTKKKIKCIKDDKDKQSKKYTSADLRNEEAKAAKKQRSSNRSQSSIQGDDEERTPAMIESSNIVSPHFDTYDENIEHFQDEHAASAGPYSDYYQSLKDLPSQKREKAGDQRKREMKTYDPVHKHRNLPPKGAKGQPIEDVKEGTFESRRKSRYRQTKEDIRSKQKSRSSMVEDPHGHTRSVEVDLSDNNEGSDIRVKQDKSKKFLTHEPSSDDDLYEDSKHKSIGSYKPIKSRDYKGVKKYDLSKYHKDSKSGDREHSGDESDKGDDMEEDKKSGKLQKSSSKKSPQGLMRDTSKQSDKQSDKLSVSKKYNLKDRMTKIKGEKVEYGQVDDNEHYSDDKEVKKSGRRYGKRAQEDTKHSKHTPNKAYDISKGSKKRSVPESQTKSTQHLKQKGLQSSSEEGEGGNSPLDQYLRDQPLSGSPHQKSANKKSLKSDKSVSAHKLVKADLQSKAKLSHDSLKKLGKRSDQKHSSKDSEDSPNMGEEPHRKYDLQSTIEKAAKEKIKKQNEESKRSTKKPSKGIEQKTSSEESPVDTKGKFSKKPKHGKMSQQDEYSPPIVTGDEQTHHDIQEYDKKTHKHSKGKPAYGIANLDEEDFEDSKESKKEKSGKKSEASGHKDKSYQYRKQDEHLPVRSDEFDEEGKYSPGSEHGEYSSGRDSQRIPKRFDSQGRRLKHTDQPKEEGKSDTPSKQGSKFQRYSEEIEHTPKYDSTGRRIDRGPQDEYYEDQYGKSHADSEGILSPAPYVSKDRDEDHDNGSDKDRDNMDIPYDQPTKAQQTHKLDPRIRVPEDQLYEGEHYDQMQRDPSKKYQRYIGEEDIDEEAKHHQINKQGGSSSKGDLDDQRISKARHEKGLLQGSDEADVGDLQHHEYSQHHPRDFEGIEDEGEHLPLISSDRRNQAYLESHGYDDKEEIKESQQRDSNMNIGFIGDRSSDLYQEGEIDSRTGAKGIHSSTKPQTISGKYAKSGEALTEEYLPEGVITIGKDGVYMINNRPITEEEYNKLITGSRQGKTVGGDYSSGKRLQFGEHMFAAGYDFEGTPQSKATPTGQIARMGGEFSDDEFEDEKYTASQKDKDEYKNKSKDQDSKGYKAKVIKGKHQQRDQKTQEEEKHGVKKSTQNVESRDFEEGKEQYHTQGSREGESQTSENVEDANEPRRKTLQQTGLKPDIRKGHEFEDDPQDFTERDPNSGLIDPRKTQGVIKAIDEYQSHPSGVSPLGHDQNMPQYLERPSTSNKGVKKDHPFDSPERESFKGIDSPIGSDGEEEMKGDKSKNLSKEDSKKIYSDSQELKAHTDSKDSLQALETLGHPEISGSSLSPHSTFELQHRPTIESHKETLSKHSGAKEKLYPAKLTDEEYTGEYKKSLDFTNQPSGEGDEEHKHTKVSQGKERKFDDSNKQRETNKEGDFKRSNDLSVKDKEGQDRQIFGQHDPTGEEEFGDEGVAGYTKQSQNVKGKQGYQDHYEENKHTKSTKGHKQGSKKIDDEHRQRVEGHDYHLKTPKDSDSYSPSGKMHGHKGPGRYDEFEDEGDVNYSKSGEQFSRKSKNQDSEEHKSSKASKGIRGTQDEFDEEGYPITRSEDFASKDIPRTNKYSPSARIQGHKQPAQDADFEDEEEAKYTKDGQLIQRQFRSQDYSEENKLSKSVKGVKGEQDEISGDHQRSTGERYDSQGKPISIKYDPSKGTYGSRQPGHDEEFEEEHESQYTKDGQQIIGCSDRPTDEFEEFKLFKSGKGNKLVKEDIEGEHNQKIERESHDSKTPSIRSKYDPSKGIHGSRQPGQDGEFDDEHETRYNREGQLIKGGSDKDNEDYEDSKYSKSAKGTKLTQDEIDAEHDQNAVKELYDSKSQSILSKYDPSKGIPGIRQPGQDEEFDDEHESQFTSRGEQIKGSADKSSGKAEDYKHSKVAKRTKLTQDELDAEHDQFANKESMESKPQSISTKYDQTKGIHGSRHPEASEYEDEKEGKTPGSKTQMGKTVGPAFGDFSDEGRSIDIQRHLDQEEEFDGTYIPQRQQDLKQGQRKQQIPRRASGDYPEDEDDFENKDKKRKEIIDKKRRDAKKAAHEGHKDKKSGSQGSYDDQIEDSYEFKEDRKQLEREDDSPESIQKRYKDRKDRLSKHITDHIEAHPHIEYTGDEYYPDESKYSHGFDESGRPIAGGSGPSRYTNEYDIDQDQRVPKSSKDEFEGSIGINTSPSKASSSGEIAGKSYQRPALMDFEQDEDYHQYEERKSDSRGHRQRDVPEGYEAESGYLPGHKQRITTGDRDYDKAVIAEMREQYLPSRHEGIMDDHDETDPDRQHYERKSVARDEADHADFNRIEGESYPQRHTQSSGSKAKKGYIPMDQRMRFTPGDFERPEGEGSDEHYDAEDNREERKQRPIKGDLEYLKSIKDKYKPETGKSGSSHSSKQGSSEDEHKHSSKKHKDMIGSKKQSKKRTYDERIESSMPGQKDADASFEFSGAEASRHADNIFSTQQEDEEEEIHEPTTAKFSRNLNPGDKTGKFGKAQDYHFAEGQTPKSSEHLKTKQERDAYIKRKAQEKRNNRLKQYLSGEPRESESDEVLGGSQPLIHHDMMKGDSHHKSSAHESLKREIDRHYGHAERASTDGKSLQDQLFEGQESRIQSREQTFEHDERNKNKASFGQSDSRGYLYGPDGKRFKDESEIKGHSDHYPEYDQRESHGSFGDKKRGSVDSDELYLTKFAQQINPRTPVKDTLRAEHQPTKNIADRIINSQSVHQLSKDSDSHLMPDGHSYTDFKKRKYTENIEGQYDPANNLYQDYQDMTGDTLDMEYSLLDPEEPLIVDHGIMKFHPGFSINYVSRWVQVTKTVIRFYKNYYHSVCSFRRPLVVIPLNAVGSIKNFKLVPKKSNAAKVLSKGKNAYDQNQFEIVLKEDYEAIYDLNKRKKEVEDLKYEIELIQQLEYQNKLTRKYKRYRKRCKMSKSPVPTFRMFMETQKDEINKLSRSHPRLSVYSKLYDDDMSRADNKSTKTFDNLRNHSVISRGRHSHMEASGDRSVISIDEQYIHKSVSRSKSKKKRVAKSNGLSTNKKSRTRAKTPFDTTMIVDGHLMPIRVNKKERNGKSTFRQPSSTKKAKVPRVHWSKRETDWFKFERRFILATKTNKEKRKWMKVLRNLIPK